MGVETDDRQRQVIMKYIHSLLFFFVLLATPMWAQDPPADPPAAPPAAPPADPPAQPKPEPKDPNGNDYSPQLPMMMPPDGDGIPYDHFEPGGGWNCPCLRTCQNKSVSARR